MSRVALSAAGASSREICVGSDRARRGAAGLIVIVVGPATTGTRGVDACVSTGVPWGRAVSLPRPPSKVPLTFAVR